MTGKIPFNQLITALDAMELFNYANAQEIIIAKDLYIAYKEKQPDNFRYLLEIFDGKYLFDFLRFLSFVYDTGRVQGIREERAKKYRKS